MCEFCENIAKDDSEFVQHRFDGGDFIYKDEKGHAIFIDTGDSFCPGILNDTKFCPKCGRDLRKQIDERANS